MYLAERGEVRHYRCGPKPHCALEDISLRLESAGTEARCGRSRVLVGLTTPYALVQRRVNHSIMVLVRQHEHCPEGIRGSSMGQTIIRH
jgi:hypothetical protein